MTKKQRTATMAGAVVGLVVFREDHSALPTLVPAVVFAIVGGAIGSISAREDL